MTQRLGLRQKCRSKDRRYTGITQETALRQKAGLKTGARLDCDSFGRMNNVAIRSGGDQSGEPVKHG